MAKQNVTFVERHVEKFVVGVAGAALLGIAVLYLIGTPHKVEVDGVKLGPERFYTQLREKAEQARNRMKDAQPDQDVPGGGTPISVADCDAQRSPYDYERIPKEFALVFAQPGPAVPEVGSGPARGKIRLADILPPEPVLVTTGRAFTKLDEPQTIVPGEKTTSSEAGQLSVTRDHQWVTVVAAVHRKDQREKFDEAHYAPNRQKLIVAAVEAQRQQRLPGGEWGEPVLVNGYSPHVIHGRDRVELVKEGDSFVIYDSERDYIRDYRVLLETPEGQAMILRPALQEVLAYPFDWVIPAELPGTDIKWVDYEVLLPPDEESDESGPGARGRERDRPVGRSDTGRDLDRSPRAQIKRLSEEAKEAIANEEYIEAGDLLNEIIDNADATLKQVESAQLELLRIQANIDQAVIEQEEEGRRQAQAAKEHLGEDIEPLWLNDLSVTPGATYRYRLRLLAYNPYVGMAFKLEKPEDAARVVTAGKWSEWSEPVQVEPALHLFLASAKDGFKRVKLEIREWMLGRWDSSGSQEVGVGEPVAFNVNRHDFTYNAVVVDVADRVDYQVRLVNRAGEISYRPKPTAAMVLITSDGEVEERIAAVDNRRRQKLTKANKDYKKSRAKYMGTDRPPKREKRQPQRPGRPGPRERHPEDMEDEFLLLR